ncbi:MAG: hypothetical protein ACYDAY_00495 [Candidatus Dormibacteria bacterium]
MTSPSPFAGVLGHGRVIAYLERQRAAGRLSHAYLLAGPPRIGKTHLARSLAQALLPEADLNRHPDYWEDDEERALAIDTIRGGPRWTPDPELSHQSDPLQAFLWARPLAGAGRVALIARAHRMEQDSAAALLKTLEEPPPGARLLLTTENAVMVPRTVVSRCQVLHLEPVPASVLTAGLVARGCDPVRAARVTAAAGGAPGAALEALSDPGLEALVEESIDRLRGLLGAGRRDLLDASRALAEGPAATPEERRRRREQLLAATSAWLCWLGDVNAAAAGAEDLVVLRHRMEQIRSDAAQRPALAWATMLARCVRMRAMIRRYVPPRLALDAFLLQSAHASPAPAPASGSRWRQVLGA